MNWIAAIRKGQKSPLARRIIAFNLVGLSLLVSGILYLNQFRETASELRISQLRVEAGIFSAALGHLAEKEGVFRLEDPEIFALAEKLTAEADGVVQLFSVSGNPLGENVPLTVPVAAVDKSTNSLVDVFRDVRDKIAGLIVRRDQPVIGRSQTALYSSMAIGAVQAGAMRVSTSVNEADQVIVAAAMPVFNGGRAIGGIVLATQAGEIDAVLRKERSEILQVFALAILISIALSVLLARTIARPLEELTEAAEMGSVQKTGKLNPGRIHIPDMSARPDEIGALSRQMRAMTEALYDRIEVNESFAADVVHELKNPLTSLSSAVETLGYAKSEDARKRLFEVINQDVHRMDRLITDISNASRLDAELAKDDLEPIDLRGLLSSLVDYQAELAKKNGVRVVGYFPDKPLIVPALEHRLGQVFVNLISNAVSFVDEGGTVSVRARAKGADAVQVLVEDTGPGIPEENLGDVFKRFYSSRPENQFGNNSGLGLAISRQIVEAHGGAIWAENIREEGAEPDSPPKGARFVVELPT